MREVHLVTLEVRLSDILYQVLCILIYLFWNFADKKKVIGYIHRVSPLKNSSRTPYFDRVFQTSAGQMRAVRFYPENSRSKFKALSEKKSPVKLTQFRSNTKFGRTDLVIDRRTKVSEAATKLPFKRATGLEEQENLDISSISQLAKLCQLSGTKVVCCYKSRPTEEAKWILS